MTLTLKDGGYYLDREGNIVGPLRQIAPLDAVDGLGRPDYTFVMDYGDDYVEYYRSDGGWKTGNEACPSDLVAECPPDRPPKDDGP